MFNYELPYRQNILTEIAMSYRKEENKLCWMRNERLVFSKMQSLNCQCEELSGALSKLLGVKDD